MTTPPQNTVREHGSTIVVTVSVVATVLTLLGSAVAYTQHVSRMADRSRKTAQALEVGDGHLEYLFTSWRNISRAPALRLTYRQPATNFFFTDSYNPGPQPTPWTSPYPYPSPWPGAPPTISKPSSALFPSVPNYTVSQYRIQAVTPMIELDANGNSTLGPAANPPAAYGPNTWQYSYFYLASVDVSLPAVNGSVTAKVRRVFEKKYDNPWTFAMFYIDDLELHPSSPLTINGPIQTNSSLYIGTSNFTATSRVGYGGDYLNGYSPNDTSGHAGSITNPNFPSDLPPSQESPYLPFGWNLKLTNEDGSVNNDSYHELIERPNTSSGANDPLQDVRYYNQASYRILIDASNNITLQQYNPTTRTTTNITSGSLYNIFTSNSGNESGAVISRDKSIYDSREGAYVRTTTIDISRLTTAANNNQLPGWNGIIYVSDTSSGTPVSSKVGTASVNNVTKRGIRLINGSTLPNSGLTVVSENPVYIVGNYNTGGSPPSNSGTYTSPTVNGYNRKYAAVIGDAINVLSSNWNDSNSTLAISNRVAVNTTINAALVGGIVPSGGGNYSGGGENFVRLLEDWSTKSFTYYGSMVQLYTSLQGTGPFSASGSIFMAPQTMRFFYDTNFGNGSPPGNLQIASYLQQQRWYQVY